MTPDVMNHANVRMMQPGDGSRLAFEPRARFRLFRDMLEKYFDGNVAIESRIMGLVDFAHTACTDQFNDLVMTKTRSGRQGHNRALCSISPPISRMQKF